jgi:phosphatidylglycerophosphate synthase
VSDGEDWARELLRALRADRYRLRAWRRFFALSFARARSVRNERRREHRQVLLVGAAGLAAWAAVAAFRPWLALAGALWWLLVTLMVDWHLGMLEDEHGRPLHGLGLANLLTLARAAVIPALPIVSPSLLVALLLPAGLSDGVDGPLARRRREETRLGVWLDGSVDTLLLSAAAVGAARHGLVPWWTASLVVARHAAPWVFVSLAYFIRAEAPQLSRLASGKAAGLLLFGGLVVAALRLPGAVPLVVLGVTGGLATLAVRLVRAQPVRGRPLLPPPA